MAPGCCNRKVVIQESLENRISPEFREINSFEIYDNGLIRIMVSISNTNSLYMNFPAEKPHAPGKTKIMAALRSLLEDKEFVSITTAEIARNAGVTEALIYKYFHDKRDLLHQVLAEYLGVMITRDRNRGSWD